MVVDEVVEVTSGTIIEKGCSVFAELDVLVQGNDIGVVGEEVVEGALLFPTGRIERDF